ncbi:class I adenylate-forming enzyme family protein [Actinoplanes sp. NPDC049548]|uniref:class I adenylate-forming enzyme family protein n=1 Tax=Actinoplanes sp. NPDC049548 TaxID=3155152 RepID=UPI00342D39F7
MSTSTRETTSEPAGLDEVADILGGPRLDDLLRRAAGTAPARVALTGTGGTVTYADLDAAVSRCAGALRSLVAPDEDRTPVVAIGAVLDPVFAVAFYGVSRAGLTSAIVNPLLREEGLRHVLRAGRARVAIVPPELYRRIARIRDDLPDLATVVLTEGAPDLDGVPVLGDLLDAAAVTGEPAATDPEAPAAILFTSGTTGAPKAVGLTHRNLTVNAAQTARAQGLDATSVIFNYLPTFHLMHLNIAVTVAATQVLGTDQDVVASVQTAARHGATHYYSLPVRLARLSTDPRLSTTQAPTLQGILSGGSALPPTAAATLSAHFGVPVAQGYGLAEASPSTHFDRFGEHRPGSCGRPVAGTGCRIVHVDDRTVLPAGEKGEIQVRGPQIIRAYLNEPETPVVDPDGWFSTGDVGYIDTDGYLFLVDRIKDVFKCDNWLVAPTEVERVLARHPEVAECVVLDYPDEARGAVAAALVVPRVAGADIADAVTAFVADQVPYYQRLHVVELVDRIPRSQNGKIMRRELRELLLELRPLQSSAEGEETGGTSC